MRQVDKKHHSLPRSEIGSRWSLCQWYKTVGGSSNLGSGGLLGKALSRFGFSAVGLVVRAGSFLDPHFDPFCQRGAH
jgi:hypothetical protein